MIDAAGSSSSQEVRYNVNIYTSPGMSKYYTPECALELKPFVGQEFPNLDMAIRFYRRYAAFCGFDTRKGSEKLAPDKTICWKYVVCSREGEKNVSVSSGIVNGDSVKISRRKACTRCGCEALIAFRIMSGGRYSVQRFQEQHSHPLCNESFRHFLKANRSLNAGHQNFIINCAKANIGPTKSFRLFKEVVRGYENVGCTCVDFRNFSRDLRAYVAGADAQMLLDNLSRKREISPGFYFAYSVDEKDHLTRLFWSDPISRRNYAAFGDVISFDATYETNRYHMIFCPFTGIDNYGKIVTFGAALLSNEDGDSYTWLFTKFKDCMGCSPGIIITDQDRGIKFAVESVLKDSRRRLCMWHITKKFLDKLPARLKHDTSFKTRIDKYIWSELIEPEEFEKGWCDVISEYELNDNIWFQEMFAIRDDWIPAYFRDVPLSGLMKTTSLSESVNSFFCRYLHTGCNLVEFFMQFDSAIDAQRHAQDLIVSQSASSNPTLKTPLPLEKHALEIYTPKVFLDIQKDIIDSCFTCRVMDINNTDTSIAYKLNAGIDVVYNKAADTYECSCKKFIRLGILCSHIFVLFRDMKVDAIPDKYVLHRWTKGAAFNNMFVGSGSISQQFAEVQERKLMMSKLYSEFCSCIGLIEGNFEEMTSFLSSMRQYRESISTADSSSQSLTGKRKLFGSYYGSDVPDVISVFPPLPVKTKGSGRRIKSAKEQAIEQSKKPLRLCKKCNQRTNHDSRNCDKVSGRSDREE